ncbi:MAG: thermonuclease family protein [Alphaproteobacteria bacterium]|nr:thermonuclease family protein [Alphaproteobacteria bacterium]
MTARVIAIAATLLLASQTSAATDARVIAGPAEVLDGNHLIVAGQRVRLFGSDAPDLAQHCTYESRTYACGDVARTALMDLVAGARVRCRLRGSSSEPAATCTVQRADVAANMVHTGWALANTAEIPTYAGIEAKARRAGRGLWRGGFVRPAEWRRGGGPTETLCVRGRLTAEGTECPALRDQRGTLYTLAPDRPGGLPQGQEVCVCGAIAETSTCMQGRTIAVTRLVDPAACP